MIMNPKYISTLFTVACIASFLSCKKDSDSTPAIPSIGTWTLNSTSYTGVSSQYFLSSFLALDTKNNTLSIDFNGAFYNASKKPISGSYTVLKYGGTATSANQCVISAGNQSSTTPFRSTGKSGDVVTISVSSTGKLSASFANITVSDGTTTTTVSGSIQEQ